MNTETTRPGIKLVCTNAQGLTASKLLDHLYCLREQRVDIAVLTEMRMAFNPEDLLRQLPGAGTIWHGVQFMHCPGTGHTEGICVIISPTNKAMNPTYRPHAGTSGRILAINASFQDTPITLVAAYAPAQALDRPAFFRDFLLPSLPTDGRPLLLVGDLNCILAEEDAVYPPSNLAPNPSSRMRGSAELANIMALFQLHDVWRDTHPGTRDFTHWSTSATSGGRLDRWLASEAFLHRFSADSQILPTAGFLSDHRPITLRIDCIGIPQLKGKGIQGFPLLLLNNPEACITLQNLISAQALLLTLVPDAEVVHAWDNMKEVLRRRSWLLFKDLRKSRMQAARDADTAASSAFSALRVATAFTFHPLLQAALT